MSGLRRIKNASLAGLLSILIGWSLPATAAGKAEMAPFPLSGNFSQKLQKYAGVTAATNFLTSQALSLGLSLKLHGHVRVRLETYSLTDLLAGKVKSVRVDMTDARLRRVPISKLHIEEQKPIWFSLFKSGGRSAGLRSPVLLQIEGDVSGHDVACGLASKEIASNLRSVKLDLPGLGGQELQFLEPVVTVHPERVIINSTLVTRGAAASTGVPITLTGTPELVDKSKIFISNLTISSPDIPNPEEFAQFTSRLLNPIINFARMDRQTHAFRMESLQILEDQVHFNGNLLLAPKLIPANLAMKSRK